MERKKSEIVARMAQYHLSAVGTLAASTVAPDIWKLLNSRFKQLVWRLLELVFIFR
jgi:hypothetical protein